jgi:DMSO/TMAO reductase YedYZ molybdopterin-dependent catalytic subunit
MNGDQHDEGVYDERRLNDFIAGRTRGFSRRDLLKLTAAVGAATGLGATTASSPASAAPPVSAAGPIVKPLPPELFKVHGTNAETLWSSLKGQGYYVPVDQFFVRNHTSTPIIDPASWSLEVSGSGLRGGAEHFSLRELRRLPAESRTIAVECAGNARSYFTTQQGQTVSGTSWGLGAVGVAHWRGVKLSTVLRRAGLSRHAVDVQPSGLDADFVSGGVDLGPVRRPFPLAKALDDVLLAYEMNGEPLPADHGAPLRVLVPGWIGIASIKWVGRIEVSAEPLFSPWNTQFYRLFGAGFPVEGQPFDRQVVKSAFELDPGATFPAGVRTRLTGRSWSASGPIKRTEVSTDGGVTWQRARPYGATPGGVWQRWELDWTPAAGAHTLLARATDVRGNTQPEVATHNTLGYLFDASVRVPVTAA